MMAAMSEIVLSPSSLVVLVGVSGSGKSTFAATRFRPTEILSSDAFRAMVADDEADQGATRAAFELLHLAARRRLERGRLTVIDATSLTRSARSSLVAVARSTSRPAVAIVLDPPLAVCLERNAARPGRTVDGSVVRRQHDALRRALAADDDLASEGFARVHRLTDVDLAAVVRIEPRRVRDTGGAAAGTIPQRASGSKRR
jgi:protein phosphatase